jgi:hypothetical protein
MRVAFRGGTQHFSNVFHYGSLAANPSAGDANDLIAEAVGILKGLHSTDVSFVKARLWSSGGTQAQNQMIAENTLTGTGTLSTQAEMDPERAILIQWPAGLDSLGRKVYLRKWFHCCSGVFGGVGMTSGHRKQTTAFTSAERTTMANAADALTRLGATEGWGLVAESGRERDGGAPIAHKFLEHHQFGEEWRG